MFLYQGWYFHKEKETSFLTLGMTNFGFTATSLVEIWTSSLGLLLFFFFNQGLSSAFDFSTSKDFSLSKKLPRENFVKCVM